MAEDRVFVWLSGEGKARIITDADNVKGGKLTLGTDYISQVLGKGIAPNTDGSRRISVIKVKKIR